MPTTAKTGPPVEPASKLECSVPKIAEESEELILADSSGDEENTHGSGGEPVELPSSPVAMCARSAGESVEDEAKASVTLPLGDIPRDPSVPERSGTGSVKSDCQSPEDHFADEETPAQDNTNLEVDDVSVLIACHRVCSVDGGGETTDSSSTLLDSFPTKREFVEHLETPAQPMWGTDSSVVEGMSNPDTSISSGSDESSSLARVSIKQVLSEPIISGADRLGAGDTSSETTLTTPSYNISDLPKKNEVTSFLSEAAALPHGDSINGGVQPSQIVTTEEYLESEPSELACDGEADNDLTATAPVVESSTPDSSSLGEDVGDAASLYTANEAPSETAVSMDAIPPKIPLFRHSAASVWSEMDRTPMIKLPRLTCDTVRDESLRAEVLPPRTKPPLTLPSAAFTSMPQNVTHISRTSTIHAPTTTITYLPTLTTYQPLREVSKLTIQPPPSTSINYMYNYIQPTTYRPPTSWQATSTSFSMATSPLKHLKELRENGLSPSIHFQPTANTTYYSALPTTQTRSYATYMEPRQYYVTAPQIQAIQKAQTSMVTSLPTTYYPNATIQMAPAQVPAPVASMARDWSTAMSVSAGQPDSARSSTADQLLAHKPAKARTDKLVRDSAQPPASQSDCGISCISRCRRGRRLLFGSPLR